MIRVQGVAGALAVLIAIVAAGPAGAGEVRAAPAPPPAAPTPTSPVAPPIVITWAAPEGCPSEGELKSEVRRMAGPATATAEATEAHAAVRREHDGSWQLTLTTKVGALSGERKLSASDCAELGRATALVIALMINPAADLSAAPPVATPPPAPSPSAPVPPARYRRYALGAKVEIGSGELPGGAAGLGLRFAIGGGAFSAQLRGDVWLPRDAASAAKPSAGGSFDAAELGVAGCASARPDGRLTPAICAGAAITGTHATGFGINNAGATTAVSAAPFLEAALRVKIASWNALRLGLGAMAPLQRPTFALAGVGAVFRPAPFWLRAGLGWELNF